MSLTRKLLRELELNDDTIERIISAHVDTVDALRQMIVSFAPQEDGESSALSQARHAQAALRACGALEDAMRAIDAGMPLDVCAVDLSDALDALGEITGETLNEQVIDEVFARFCVGK